MDLIFENAFRNIGVDNDQNLKKIWRKREHWWLDFDRRWLEQTQTKQLNDKEDEKKGRILHGKIEKALVKTLKV